MSATSTDATPRVWLGCIACYEAGKLTGEWFDAEAADTITPAMIHKGENPDHESLWVFDHENLPLSHEMSPAKAAAWAQVLLVVRPDQRAALTAWMESGAYESIGEFNLPEVNTFNSVYRGHFESFSQFAEQEADSIGLLADVPEAVSRYFNWAAYTRDLEFDYVVYDAPDGGVFVFDHV